MYAEAISFNTAPNPKRGGEHRTSRMDKSDMTFIPGKIPDPERYNLERDYESDSDSEPEPDYDHGRGRSKPKASLPKYSSNSHCSYCNRRIAFNFSTTDLITFLFIVAIVLFLKR